MQRIVFFFFFYGIWCADGLHILHSHQCYTGSRFIWSFERLEEKQCLRRHRDQSSIAHHINHGWKTSTHESFSPNRSTPIGQHPRIWNHFTVRSFESQKNVHHMAAVAVAASDSSPECVVLRIWFLRTFFFSGAKVEWFSSSIYSCLECRRWGLPLRPPPWLLWTTDFMKIKSFIVRLCWFLKLLLYIDVCSARMLLASMQCTILHCIILQHDALMHCAHKNKTRTTNNNREKNGLRLLPAQKCK